jgi:hypothetical protein
LEVWVHFQIRKVLSPGKSDPTNLFNGYWEILADKVDTRRRLKRDWEGEDHIKVGWEPLLIYLCFYEPAISGDNSHQPS